MDGVIQSAFVTHHQMVPVFSSYHTLAILCSWQYCCNYCLLLYKACVFIFSFQLIEKHQDRRSIINKVFMFHCCFQNYQILLCCYFISFVVLFHNSNKAFALSPSTSGLLCMCLKYRVYKQLNQYS